MTLGARIDSHAAGSTPPAHVSSFGPERLAWNRAVDRTSASFSAALGDDDRSVIRANEHGGELHVRHRASDHCPVEKIRFPPAGGFGITFASTPCPIR